MNIFKIILVALLIVFLSFKIAKGDEVKTITVPTPVVDEVKILTPVEYADKYTTQYQVDSTLFKKVMWCESKNNPNPPGYNDGGSAFGIMQFHKQTFYGYAKLMGEDLNYDSYQDQIKLAAWMWSKGEQHHWTCYSIVKGK